MFKQNINKFSRQVDLAEYLVINIDTLNKWTKKYKKYGLTWLIFINSGGEKREAIPQSIYKEIEKKIQMHHFKDIQMQFLGSNKNLVIRLSIIH